MSCCPPVAVGQIWALADPGNLGYLRFDGFVVAVRMAAILLASHCRAAPTAETYIAWARTAVPLPRFAGVEYPGGGHDAVPPAPPSQPSQRRASLTGLEPVGAAPVADAFSGVMASLAATGTHARVCAQS